MQHQKDEGFVMGLFLLPLPKITPAFIITALLHFDKPRNN